MAIPLTQSTQATETANLISNGVEDTCTPLACSIKKMIRDFPPLSPNCCIYRAPKRFKSIDEKLFIPQVVSIGPLHHGREELLPMENLKVAYLDSFLERSHLSLEKCIKLVKEDGKRIRDCYSERIEFTSDDFVKMILLDSCFVIDAIYRRCLMPPDQAEDYLSHISITKDVRSDMILLENQLPFFVLEGLFNLAFHPIAGTGCDFVSLSVRYFRSFMLTRDLTRAFNYFRCRDLFEIRHFLDLLRMCHAPSFQRPPQVSSRQDITMPRVIELEEAGMVIKQGPSNGSILDICYTKGVLEIPKVVVSNKTILLVNNLLALEFCRYREDPYITYYIQFMDQLMDNYRDIDTLIRSGVIESLVSDSKEVTTLFTNTRGTLFSKGYIYSDIRKGMNAYCQIPWHKWKAILRRDYCNSPWIIASTMAAVTLLVLTFIQSICSIIAIQYLMLHTTACTFGWDLYTLKIIWTHFTGYKDCINDFIRLFDLLSYIISSISFVNAYEKAL